jgi:hypothetical protein
MRFICLEMRHRSGFPPARLRILCGSMRMGSGAHAQIIRNNPILIRMASRFFLRMRYRVSGKTPEKGKNRLQTSAKNCLTSCYNL